MATPTITPTYQHALDYLKGWPNPAAVDFVAKFDTSQHNSIAYGGRVVHVNQGASNLQFALGAVGTQMPVFLIQGNGEYDVSNFTTGDAQSWYAVAPAGWMSGLVAIGAYELQTTEYDTNSTFNINDPLHAPTEAQITSGTDYSMAGQLYNARKWPGGNSAAITAYTDHICGIVSRGTMKNSLRMNTLSFWPVFFPGNSATT